MSSRVRGWTASDSLAPTVTSPDADDSALFFVAKSARCRPAVPNVK
jgi:hypothetical protein